MPRARSLQVSELLNIEELLRFPLLPSLLPAGKSGMKVLSVVRRVAPTVCYSTTSVIPG